MPCMRMDRFLFQLYKVSLYDLLSAFKSWLELILSKYDINDYDSKYV
jgi:hypothetical protein